MPLSHLLTTEQVLSVRDLSICFEQQGQFTQVVENISFTLSRGETLAIVGESGSGKSVTGLALMRLLNEAISQTTCEQLLLRRRNQKVADLLALSPTQMCNVRGADIAMIFQEPMNSLNPVFPIGIQIAETIQLHQKVGHKVALEEARRMLEMVRIPDAKEMLKHFPHQLSGGMRQRVMIAMALSCHPAVLIADEPTAALDATMQAKILQLLGVLQDDMQMGMIFITHDMGVVADIADRVLVMYRGKVVESGSVEQIFCHPQHGYTQLLLSAVSHLGSLKVPSLPQTFPTVLPGNCTDSTLYPRHNTVPLGEKPLLEVRDLVTRFPLRSGLFNRVKREIHAVEKVSFDLRFGETLSLFGESGCGKSTIGRSLLRLVKSQSGTIIFDGQRIDHISHTEMQSVRKNIQFIFQDPMASLDPRQTVGDSVIEPLLVHKVMSRQQAEQRCAWLLERVGLQPEHASRYPNQFSAGECLRICIARALALNPKVMIVDEPISALDVSIRAQIIHLLLDLQQDLGIAFLCISHDMAVVERISHRVAVIYLGQIVEIGPCHAVFENPQHPYTRKLLAAARIADPTIKRRKRILFSDEIPSMVRILGDEPYVAPLVEVGSEHFVARHIIGFS